jgi:hypothetical protein
VLSAYWVVTAGLAPTALSVVAGDHDLYKEEGKYSQRVLFTVSVSTASVSKSQCGWRLSV